MFSKFRIWLYEHGYNDAYDKVLAELTFMIEEYKTKLEYEKKIYELTTKNKSEFKHKSNMDEYGYGGLALQELRDRLTGQPQQNVVVDEDNRRRFDS